MYASSVASCLKTSASDSSPVVSLEKGETARGVMGRWKRKGRNPESKSCAKSRKVVRGRFCDFFRRSCIYYRQLAYLTYFFSSVSITRSVLSVCVVSPLSSFPSPLALLSFLKRDDWGRVSICMVIARQPFVENAYLSLRFPNMVKLNIHKHWTRVTRFNPLWVSGLSQNSHRRRQTNAGDKGYAEACAERFSALKDQYWRHVVSSLSRGHFRNVFLKFSEMLRFWSFIFL